MDGEEKITLAEIGRGAAVERFDIELQKVLDNIQDPNTDPKKVRSVTLKITINPSEDRQVASYAIDGNSKLAPLKAVPGRMFLGVNKHGKGVASEEHPTQVEMTDMIRPADAKIYKVGNKEAQG
jgi:hypothetical protein